MARLEILTLAVLIIVGTQGNPCTNMHCPAGSTCITLLDGTGHCFCPGPSVGTNCLTVYNFISRQFNPCANHHCLNGGHCIAPTDAPYCVCPSGFTGLHCHETHQGKRELVIPCAISTCPNGKACTITITLSGPIHNCT